MDVTDPDTRPNRELVGELLEICEHFFAHSGPATLHELDTHLRAHGNHGGPGWLIDMLGLTRLDLERETTNTN